jgi:hypothetical protein
MQFAAEEEDGGAIDRQLSFLDLDARTTTRASEDTHLPTPSLEPDWRPCAGATG